MIRSQKRQAWLVVVVLGLLLLFAASSGNGRLGPMLLPLAAIAILAGCVQLIRLRPRRRRKFPDED